MQEQLSQQLPGSFASMSTSYASPQAAQGSQHVAMGPHDPAWFRHPQTSQAQFVAVQNALSQRQQQAYQQQQQAYEQLQDPFSGANGSLLLQQQQQHQQSDAYESLLQQPHHHSGASEALLLQQQLQVPAELSQVWQQDLNQQSGLSQQQSLLLLAAQQQLLQEQRQASQLQWDQQQQQQLLLAAASMQPLGETSHPLPTALLQQQQQHPEGTRIVLAVDTHFCGFRVGHHRHNAYLQFLHGTQPMLLEMFIWHL